MKLAYIEEFHLELKKWESLGIEEIPNRCKRIGHVPHVAPMAYLHEVYAPLDETDVDDLEQKISRTFPKPLREFYRHHNGLRMFSETFVVYGSIKNLDRSDFSYGVYCPIDLQTSNIPGRPGNAQEATVFFGGYVEDFSKLYLDAKNRVIRCPKEDASKILNMWENLGEWLVTETRRLNSLFDEAGKETIYYKDLIPTPDLTN